MHCRVAVISDVHFTRERDEETAPTRQGWRGKELLTDAVHMVNEEINPDIVLVLGDLVDDGETEAGPPLLRELRPAVDLIEAPMLVLPGNHDPAPEEFYRVFEPLPEWMDADGVRFVPFVDPEAPEFNAWRPPESLARLVEAREEFDGPIVSVQHVPLFRPGACDCPYNYTNAEEILETMQAYGAVCAISGHYHRGIAVADAGGFVSISNPALCEAPFRFLEVTFSSGAIAVREHALPDISRIKQ